MKPLKSELKKVFSMFLKLQLHARKIKNSAIKVYNLDTSYLKYIKKYQTGIEC